jgi:acyl dehydratase
MTQPHIETFDDLVVPLSLGSSYFSPTIESVRKLAYAVEDETGWLVGDPRDELVHPQFLSTYMWWPSGFYVREPGAVGHFAIFHQRFPALVGRPFLHAKTAGRFLSPFRLGSPIRADITVIEKYQKRSRDFIVMRAMFFDSDNRDLATYDHTVAIRSDSIGRPEDAAASKPDRMRAPVAGQPLPHRTIALSLEKSRLFTLPAENYHTHDKHAQAMGLRVAVPAAMMSFAYLSRFAQDHLGDDWMARGELDVVFTRMIQRDDLLTVHGTVDAEEAGKAGPSLTLGIDNGRGEAVAVAKASVLAR